MHGKSVIIVKISKPAYSRYSAADDVFLIQYPSEFPNEGDTYTPPPFEPPMYDEAHRWERYMHLVFMAVDYQRNYINKYFEV